MANKCFQVQVQVFDIFDDNKGRHNYYTVLHLFSIRLNKYYMALIQWNISVGNNDLILIYYYYYSYNAQRSN